MKNKSKKSRRKERRNEIIGTHGYGLQDDRFMMNDGLPGNVMNGIF